MLQKFKSYITDNQLIATNEKTLVAVSGGIDSVVLCYLFRLSNFPFAIGHCNFKLREKEADEDAAFVEQLAQFFQVPCYSTSFDTTKIAKERGQSIQVAARELRYDWLEKIRLDHGFHYIATAHHLNDSIETVLYNFTKGCGIRGLHGILPRVGAIIRPLLFATKAEIQTFAKKKQLPWREDASNLTDKYARNKIRHQVMPALKSLNPAFEKIAGENIIRLRETEALYDFAIQTIAKELIDKQANGLKIAIQPLMDCPAPVSVLFEILKPYDFNNRQIEQMIQTIRDSYWQKPAVGKTFLTKTHCLLLDRDCLLLQESGDTNIAALLISEQDSQIDLGNRILSVRMSDQKPKAFSTDPRQVILDGDKIKFPLKLRKWQPGDFFHPFGMGGKRQKLQDFFSNNKLSKFDKEAVWILENQEEICWIVGYRLDERYKLTEATQKFLYLAIENKFGNE